MTATALFVAVSTGGFLAGMASLLGVGFVAAWRERRRLPYSRRVSRALVTLAQVCLALMLLSATAAAGALIVLVAQALTA